MALRQYIGARYVPIFMGTYDATTVYEALTVVDNGLGTSYISKKPVPAGIALNNTDYWALYGSTSGAINDLQNQINSIDTRIDIFEKYYLSTYKTDNNTDIDALNDAIAASDTVIIDYDADFGTSQSITVSNHTIYSLSNIVVSGDTLTITGDNNTINIVFNLDDHIGIKVFGNNNIIRGKYYRTNKIISTSTNYYNAAIVVTGDDNIIEAETYNSHVGVIISNNSKRDVITNSHIHDHYTGIIIAERCSDCKVVNNFIHDIDVYKTQGADGILIQCYTHNMLISNNVIDDISEHGMYLQCSDSVIDSNIVGHAGGDGIKLASYDEQNEGYYNNNSKITNNKAFDNTGTGIRIQNVCVNTIIANNNVQAIRISNVLDENYDPSKKLTIDSNNIAGALYGVFDEDCIISNNHMLSLEVTHQTASGVNCMIIGNTIENGATLNNIPDSSFINNTCKSINVLNARWDISGNTITDQDTEINLTKVRTVKDNVITFSSVGSFYAQSLDDPVIISGNILTAPDIAAAVIRTGSSNAVKGSQIINNVIHCEGDDHFLIDFYATDTVLQGNVGFCTNTTMFRPTAAYATVDTNLKIIV